MKKHIKIAYCLFFMGVCFSCEDVLEVPDISNQRVELLAPSDGSTVRDSIVNFTWNGVAEANAYLIQVATPSFENAAQIVLDSVVVLDTTFLGTKATRILPNSSYEWRVKAQNSDFETPFSVTSFAVEAPSN
ncbi:hypothetical protein [Spongiimicrobium sp. 3-5]|uniref:hypothetical protein n=1 Tax=Spongiimicrobium sp. 3-5 TaxID=3332596 RepID=UPI00397FFC72